MILVPLQAQAGRLAFLCLLGGSLCLASAGLSPAETAPAPVAPAQNGPRLTLIDARGRPADVLQAGDSLAVLLEGLTPLEPIDIVARDETGSVLGLVRTAVRRDGTVGPEILWYTSGVRESAGRGDATGGAEPGFVFAQAASRLSHMRLHVDVQEARGRAPGYGPTLASFAVPIASPRTEPLLYPSDAHGRYRAAFDQDREAIYVTGAGFASGSALELHVTRDQPVWHDGETIKDVTGQGSRGRPEWVYLEAGQTRFTVPVWEPGFQHAGRFDVLARPLDPGRLPPASLRPDDVIMHGLEAGFVVRPPYLGPLGGDRLVRLAGRSLTLSPWFEHLDVHVRHQTIEAFVDSTDIPSLDARFRYAAIYVVADRDLADWAAQTGLVDVTETVDIRPIKDGTFEINAGPIWVDPDPPTDGPVAYDVVYDFGPTTTGGSGSPRAGRVRPSAPILTNHYDAGADLLDTGDEAGFILIDDPSRPGPFAVGRTEYDFPDDYDIPWGFYHDNNVDVRAVVAYPGASDGTDVDLPPGDERYPLAVILHGNHATCNLSNPCLHDSCPESQRIPNHRGYDYLLDLWASHGFIAVSIDGFDVTCNNNRYIERGALILEHIRRWLDWDDSGIGDPTFNGRFWNRVDTGDIAVIGHSRGGEGAAAAAVLNHDLALGYAIRCVTAIAPTDQNTSSPPGGGPKHFVLEEMPFFNIMGSSDGDVYTNHGARIFDRAAPDSGRADKSQAYIYGANHNNWNTVWIDPSWNWSGDDGRGTGRISAGLQQLTAQVFITAWNMAWCQGRREMLAFGQNRARVSGLEEVRTYWSYEALQHTDIDDFQDLPADPYLNSLGGVVTVAPLPEDFLESGFRAGNYNGSFYHDTDGLIIGWRQTMGGVRYESEIPGLYQDVTLYSHFALRAAIIQDDDKNPSDQGQSFWVNLKDANGISQTIEVITAAFDPTPYPYDHPITGPKTMLSSIRIPLRAFTQEGSGLDLTQITKVVLVFQRTGLLAIDDIQFTK